MGSEKNRKPVEFTENEEGCFICTSHFVSKAGYPTCRINGKHYTIHRYIYEVHFGEVPNGYVVRHKCDNRLCINPKHLCLGTYKENSNDMVDRDRQAKGECAGNARLKELDIINIRESSKTTKELSKLFGVSERHIRSIVTRKVWKHI